MPLIEELYVDPLPNNHVLQTMMKTNTTFLIGRKGTGKSTVFQRSQHELRKKSNYTSAYIDIKTVFESSQVDASLLAKVDPASGVLTKETLEKLRLYKAFLRAVIQEISKELKERVKYTMWERIKQFITGSADELFEGLDTLLSDIDSTQFTSIIGLKTLEIHAKNDSSTESGTDASASLGLWPTPKLEASLSVKDSTTLSSERDLTYADILMREFSIKAWFKMSLNQCDK